MAETVTGTGWTASRWLLTHSRAASPTAQLVCLPYAGGNSAVYRPWAQGLAPGVELLCADYPGHGRRFSEPLPRSMADLLPGLADEVAGARNAPLYLFGHSMGGLVAFELAKELTRRGTPPAALFVSAVHPPQWNPRGNIHELDDEALLERLVLLGGIPAEVLADQQLIEVVLPVLRADVRVRETYTPLPGPALPCPVTALAGTGDRAVGAAEMAGWAQCTDGGFDQAEFPGGHFFLTDSAALLGLLNRRLTAGRARKDQERGRTR